MARVLPSDDHRFGGGGCVGGARGFRNLCESRVLERVVRRERIRSVRNLFANVREVDQMMRL